MPLPASVRVKLSSENAGSVSLTPVVSQEMTLDELMGLMVSIVGKDEARVRELLRRGTVVSEGARYRWTAIEADSESVAAVLTSFPDAKPARVFSAEHCRLIVFRQARGQTEVSRQEGSNRRLLRPRSFWDVVLPLMSVPSVTSAEKLRYVRYSYRARADEYESQVSDGDAKSIRDAASYLPSVGKRAALRQSPIRRVTLFCDR